MKSVQLRVERISRWVSDFRLKHDGSSGEAGDGKRLPGEDLGV